MKNLGRKEFITSLTTVNVGMGLGDTLLSFASDILKIFLVKIEKLL